MDKTILISLPISELQTLIVDCMHSCLQHQQKSKSPDKIEKLLTVQEAAEFLNLSVPTIYLKVSKGEIPFMKRSKRLYFSNTSKKVDLKLQVKLRMR
jgi:excisionase family DNA binding protein